jgi:SAM-dependent methyltransferase
MINRENFFDPYKVKEKNNWNGFTFGEENSNFIEYSENEEGWSDDLTEMHESLIGANHPIDVLGRSITVARIMLKMEENPAIRLLEVGCSSGYLYNDIKNKIKFGKVEYLGSDITSGPLRELAKNNKNVPFVRCDVTNSPFKKKSFDVIVALNVLEHIKNDILALSEMYNLLNNKGILILELPNNNTLFDSFDRSLNHFRRYDVDAIKNIVMNIGFKIEEISYTGTLIYPIFYIYKKYISNLLNLGHKNEIKKTGESKIFKLLIYLERIIKITKRFNFGIRLRLVLRK